MPSIVSDQCASLPMPPYATQASPKHFQTFYFQREASCRVAVVVVVDVVGTRPSHSIALPGDEPLKEHLRHGCMSEGSSVCKHRLKMFVKIFWWFQGLMVLLCTCSLPGNICPLLSSHGAYQRTPSLCDGFFWCLPNHHLCWFGSSTCAAATGFFWITL